MKKLLMLILIFSSLVGCGKSTPKTSSSSSTPIELDTFYTDQLKLTSDYNEKNFLDHNIGEAELFRCVDGDTAYFRVKSTTISVRFLSIDTPESTISIEPWGKAASAQMCTMLSNANKIVLEGDVIGQSAQLDSTNSRYLGFVWAGDDASSLINLNLFMAEQAYAFDKSTGHKYEEEFYQASLKAQKSYRRVFGELDPDYDYSGTYPDVSLLDLYKDEEDIYLGKNIAVSGYVVRKVGGSFFLSNNEISENLAGVYVFCGYTSTTYIRPGMLVQLKGTWQKSTDYGYQIAAVDMKHLENQGVISETQLDIIPIEDFTISDIKTGAAFNQLVKFNNLKLVSVYPAVTKTGDGVTIVAEDATGNQITLRVDKMINSSKVNIASEDFGIVGSFIDIVGVPSYYDGNYQLMICLKNDIIKK